MNIFSDKNDSVLNKTNDSVLNKTNEAILNDKNDSVLNKTNEVILNDKNEVILSDKNEVILSDKNEVILSDTNKIVDFNKINFSFLHVMNLCKIVINLKRRPDRLIKFIENCPFKNINTLYAFDGSNLLNEQDNFKASQLIKINKGEVGCFLSHIRCYEYMIKNNMDHMLIFEDDCNFCDNFINKLSNVLVEYMEYKSINNKNIDILYIGGRFQPNFFTKTTNCLKISDNLVKHINNNDRDNLDRTTHSYIISKYTAEFLLDIFYNSKINIPIDHWLIEICNKYNYSIYSSQPLLCYSPLVGDSDIR